MKYLITKAELKTEGQRTIVLHDPIETNNIELTRKELRQSYKESMYSASYYDENKTSLGSTAPECVPNKK